MNRFKNKNMEKQLALYNRDTEIVASLSAGENVTDIAQRHNISESRVWQIKQRELRKAIENKNKKATELADILSKQLQDQLNEIEEEIQLYKKTFDENGNRNAPIPPALFDQRLKVINSIANLYAVKDRVEKEYERNGTEDVQYIISLSSTKITKEDNLEEEIKDQKALADNIVNNIKNKESWHQQVDEAYSEDKKDT